MPLSLNLTLSHFTIWCFGQTASLLFLLAKTILAYLPTALFMALRQLFAHQQAQYAQVFSLKPGPFCKLFSDLGSTNKYGTSFLFSFCLTLVLSSPPCLLLHLSFFLTLLGRTGRKCLLSPPILSGYNGSPDTLFSRETKRLMSWPDGERYSCTLQSLVVSLLLSLVFTFLFSRTGGALSHLNSSTPKILLISTEELVLPVVVVYPTPSEGWRHGRRPLSPRSRATTQGLDQRS